MDAKEMMEDKIWHCRHYMEYIEAHLQLAEQEAKKSNIDYADAGDYAHVAKMLREVYNYLKGYDDD